MKRDAGNLRAMPDPLTAPGQIVTWALSSTSIRINWTPPEGATPAGYRIYRSIDGTNFVEIAELESPEEQPGGFFWDDTGLSHGTKYWYRIRPFFDDPAHGRMNGHTTEKAWSCTVLPGVEDVAVQPISGSTARVSWVDQSDTETGFEVRRYDLASGQWSLLTTVGAGVTEVVLNNLLPDATLYLSVRSINVETHSASSEIAPTITPPAGAGMVVHQYELSVDQGTGLVVAVPGVTIQPNRSAQHMGLKRVGWVEPGEEFIATLTNLPPHDWATVAWETQAIAYNPLGVEWITPLNPPTTVQTWVDATRVQHRVQAFEEQGSATPGFFGSVLHKEPTLTVRSRIDAATPARAEDRYVVKKLLVTLYSNSSVDLDIDTDRNNGLALPDHSNFEDLREDAADEPGKIVAVNDDDRDGDFVPDFVDGFNAFEDLDSGNPIPGPDVTPPNATQNGGFVPVVLRVPPGVDLTQAAFQVEYDASDPNCVSRTGAGTIAEPFSYTVADGLARLWTKDGTSVRKAASLRAEVPGDFVEPVSGSDFYGPDCWSKLDITTSDREKVLFLEGIAPSTAPGDLSITFRIDPDGEANGLNFTMADTVRATVVDVDVLIGANTAEDESLCDDWVAAKDTATGRVHRIYNWLRMTGPAGVEQFVTLEAPATANSGTVAFQGFNFGTTTLEPTANQHLGRTLSPAAATPFLIHGQRVSGKMDDVRVNATFLGEAGTGQAGRFVPQVFGTQSLTVMKFNPEEETFGHSSVPVNPAVVTPEGPQVGGNVFAVDVGKYNLDQPEDWHDSGYVGGGIHPRIQPLSNPAPQKFTPATIAVVWGRRITAFGTQGQIVDFGKSIGCDSSLVVAPQDPGIEGSPAAIRDNLRMRDEGVPGWAASLPPSTVVYYFGHPSESLREDLSLFQGAAVASFEAAPRWTIEFPVRIHAMRLITAGGTVDVQLVPADVVEAIREVNRIWSQAGISLALPEAGGFSIETTYDPGLFDVDDDTSNASNVASLNNDPARIDVYFVRTIAAATGSVAGTAGIRSMSGPDAMLISRQWVNPQGTTTRSNKEMGHTLAHEVAHYLLDRDNSGHRPEQWNLLRAGDEERKRDLIGVDPNPEDPEARPNQVNQARITISPSDPG